MWNDVVSFFKESYAELRKVTWLTRKEVIGSTAVIIVLIGIVSVFVAIVDWFFVKLVGVVL